MNIYKKILKKNLSKLLTLYNSDRCSSTYGFGDRLYWGWKVKDFSNATLQGGIHSLAIALKLGLVENENYILEVIESVINATEKIKHKNGSLSEAFPNEHSFCVTALVAFDILSAVDLLGDKISIEKKVEFVNIVKPLILFISNNIERHAVISNHLATAVAAIILWNRLSGEVTEKYKYYLELIYKYQSDEGWFLEYESADPGYQTLCTYYLFIVYKETHDEKLKASLIKSAGFLKYFVHPDYTIGGLYGSRNTEVYYPGGIVGLAGLSKDFAAVAGWLHRGVLNGCHIQPKNIDLENFIPLINSYSTAALYYEQNEELIEKYDVSLPFKGQIEKDFKEAGIFIKSTTRYYAILNYKKGGVIKLFDKKTNKIDAEDGGIFGRLKTGQRFSTQQYDELISFRNKEIKAMFYYTKEQYPGPMDFIILRALSIAVFRFKSIRELFKKIVVKMLITGKKKINGHVIRKFIFLEDKIIINEEIQRPKNCKIIGHSGKVKSIHMASSGYYSKQNEEMPEKSNILEFK